MMELIFLKKVQSATEIRQFQGTFSTIMIQALLLNLATFILHFVRWTTEENFEKKSSSRVTMHSLFLQREQQSNLQI